jgi:SH3 domain protein
MDARLLALAIVCAFAALGALGAGKASAEQGWVKGDLRLNLRTGGGNEYRIIGTIATGDQVTVLAKGTDWIQVRTQGEEPKVGWIPAGYLDAIPPPATRLASAEAETARLKSELEKVRGEATTLRESNAALSSNDDGQNKELETLKMENMELRAVSRYQEWLTGGLLLGGGMIAGAILQRRNANRRPSSRIRL